MATTHVYVPSVPPSVGSRRKTVLGAGLLLRQLAVTNDRLLEVLGAVQLSAPDRLRTELGTEIDKVASATGSSPEDLERCLADQLRQVAEFAVLDGGSLSDNVDAVGSLIRSGRVELFAG